MDSIKKVTNVELKENKEKLLNSMRILMHTAKGIFESTPFRDKDIAVGTGCHNLVIEAGGDTYPVFYTPDTMFADGTVAITDDIYDEENYLLLSDDDDMLWLSLVMQLDTLYKDECEHSNGLDEALKEANKKCTEYVKEIDKLEVDNKRLSERVKNLVIDKTNRPDTAEKVSDPKEDSSNTDLDLEIIRLLTRITELENENADLNQKLYQKEDEDDLKKKIVEYAQKNDDLLERNKRLNQEINKFRVQLNSYSGASVANHDDMQKTITKETFAELTARINELETTLKDKDERINLLSKNNAALSVENKNISDLLQEADRNVRFYVREVDSLEKEIKDLQAKALSDGEDIIDENHDNKPEKFGEATRAGEAFAQSIEMDMETAMLLQENTKLKEQIENLQKDNEDFERVAAAHLETTTKFADYKDRQKRLYKHFRNLAEMIEDLMELG